MMPNTHTHNHTVHRITRLISYKQARGCGRDATGPSSVSGPAWLALVPGCSVFFFLALRNTGPASGEGDAVVEV